MIDTVRSALLALRVGETPAPGGLSIIPVEGRLGSYVAMDDQHRPHLLIDRGPEPEPKFRVATLDISTRQLETDDGPLTVLDVGCVFPSVTDVFVHFVAAVLEQLRGRGTGPVAALDSVLAHWRQFLTPGDRPLGRDKLAAVFGELLVLRDVVEADPRRRVDVWRGPSAGRHDLRRAATAVEVKTTRSTASRRVTIHGEDQLLPPADGALYLHFVRLEEVPGAGRSVSDLVDDLLEMGASPEQLYDALATAGVPAADLGLAAGTTFEVRERRTFAVDDDFPRIVPASFVAGQRPTGVQDLAYVVDLDHLADGSMGAGAYETVVRELAGVQS